MRAVLQSVILLVCAIVATAVGYEISTRYIKPALVAGREHSSRPESRVSLAATQTTASKAELDAIIAADFENASKQAARHDAVSRNEERPQRFAYRWKDSEGTWHLSDNPPEDGSKAEAILLY